MLDVSEALELATESFIIWSTCISYGLACEQFRYNTTRFGVSNKGPSIVKKVLQSSKRSHKPEALGMSRDSSSLLTQLIEFEYFVSSLIAMSTLTSLAKYKDWPRSQSTINRNRARPLLAHWWILLKQ